MALEKATAKYPIKRVIVKTFTLPSNIQSENLAHVSDGPLPSRLVLGLVNSQNFNGAAEKNPFKFEHFNLNRLSITVDSKEIPYHQALNFDFANNEYIRGYQTLFEGIDKPVYANGNNISRSEYNNGYTLFAYDLSPDLCSGEHFNLLKSGSLLINLTFSKNLTSAVTVVVLMEYDNMIEINKNRQLFLDYQI